MSNILDYVSGLPEGWAQTMLSTVAVWGSGGTPSRKREDYFKGNIPWIKTGELGNKFIRDTEEKITEEAVASSSAKIFPKGSVAIAMYGATIGKTSILGIDASSNQACAIAQPIKEVIFNEYLYYYLLSQTRKFIDLGKGGAQPNISQAILKNHPILLPPIAEQQRIVDKIEELFSDLDSGINSLKTAQQQLKVYRQALLKWAFEGKLTAQWREEQQRQGQLASADTLLGQIKAEREQRYQKELEAWQSEVEAWEAKGKKPKKPSKPEYYPSLSTEEINGLSEIPREWKWEKSGNICQSIVPNRDKPKTFTGSIPWLTTPDIEPQSLSLNFSKRIGLTPEEVKQYKSRVIPSGSVIMTCVGTFGVVCIPNLETVINQQLHAFIIHPYILSKYLAYALKSQTNWMDKHATATTVSYLNKTNCNSVPIPLCSLAEQEIIVEEIESRLSICDQIEADIETNLKKAEALRQSILKQAFEGKLVPQDPNDEPAEVLLERIRSERAKVQQAQKASKAKGTKSKNTESSQQFTLMKPFIEDGAT